MDMSNDLWSLPAGAARCGVAEMRGFAVEATDGLIGTVASGGIDAGRSYLIVSIHPTLGVTTAMLPAGIVDRVDMRRAVVALGCSSEEVVAAPRFEGDRYRDAAYHAELGIPYAPRPPAGVRVGK
jgi:hypothetical protein